MYVIQQKSDKGSVEGYGSPEDFVTQFQYLLGKQAFAGVP